jgi:hypothetical protein
MLADVVPPALLKLEPRGRVLGAGVVIDLIIALVWLGLIVVFGFPLFEGTKSRLGNLWLGFFWNNFILLGEGYQSSG